MQVGDLNVCHVDCVYSVVCVCNITTTKNKVLQPLAGLFPVLQNESFSLSVPRLLLCIMCYVYQGGGVDLYP